MTVGLSTAQPGLSQPFMLYDGAVRGRLLRLNGVAQTVLDAHDYPDSVSIILGEAMAASAALSDGLKFDGSFTLQIQGNGPVHTLVTDITSNREIRGCAKFDSSELPINPEAERPTLLQLMGTGHIAFTVDQGAETDRYQGIIELAGTSIGDCVHKYFQQSEQLETAIKIVAGRTDPHNPSSAWQASAILVQRMPIEGGKVSTEDEEEAWRTAVVLLSSVSNEELLSTSLTESEVLNRLFGTVGGRLLEPRTLTVGCRCTREKSAKILASFPIDELMSMSEDGNLSMTCEFCEVDFNFSEQELRAVAEDAATAI